MDKINVTEKCDCGEPKTRTRAFCESCWSKLPDHLHADFNHAGQALQRAVRKIRRHLNLPTS